MPERRAQQKESGDEANEIFNENLQGRQFGENLLSENNGFAS
jgi:hypothetical protein